MTFVVDTSVAMAWILDDEATAYTEAVLDQLRVSGATVPAIWPLEVANALLMAERRQRLTQAQALRAIELLSPLPITVEDGQVARAWGPVRALARAHGLSAYDATYLELATREGLPLATLDGRLRSAAVRVGVPLALSPAD